MYICVVGQLMNKESASISKSSPKNLLFPIHEWQTLKNNKRESKLYTFIQSIKLTH